MDFSQLRDAALLTLGLQKKAMEHGMSLKDASAYNIQFFNGRPIHIDTLSFCSYVAERPWAAYHQFCQHFLLPLVLMAYVDVTAIRLMMNFSDGIPLRTGVRLLGNRWWRRPSLFMHLVAQAKLETDKPLITKKNYRLPKQSLVNMLTSLENLIRSLPRPCQHSHWSNYGTEGLYTSQEYLRKKEIVRHCCRKYRPRTVWDLGANKGDFSRIALEEGAQVVAIESDHAQAEALYADEQQKMSSLWMDMLTPSSMCGWAHQEHQSLAARGPADLLLCLALSHHLALTGQVPFVSQAAYFSTIAKSVLIEFIAPEDPSASQMLDRQTILRTHYTQTDFEKAFAGYFSLVEMHTVVPHKRFLYYFGPV